MQGLITWAKFSLHYTSMYLSLTVFVNYYMLWTDPKSLVQKSYARDFFAKEDREG